MKKKIFLVLIIMGIVQIAAFSQSFDKLTELIKTDEITVGQACYMVASYLSLINEKATDDAAVEQLKKAGILSEKASGTAPVKLGQLCSLYGKALKTKGGMMYSLTKASGRYAYKEFVAKGYIPSGKDPSMHVSGTDAIGLFNQITGSAK